MKIAIIHPQMAEIGGAENVVLWQSRFLASVGHEVSLFTLQYDAAKWGDEQLPFDVKLILGHQKSRLLSKNSLYLHKKVPDCLARPLSEFQIAVCHNFPSYIWCVNARKLSGSKMKIVWYCHEPYRSIWGHLIDKHYAKKRTAIKIFLKNLECCLGRKLNPQQLEIMDMEAVKDVDLILTNSIFTQKNVYKIFGKKAVTCYPGIPVWEEKKTESRIEPYFLMVGKLTRAKNVETALRGLSLLPDIYGHVKLRVVGNGSLFSSLNRLSKQIGIEKRVEFLRGISNDRLAEIYQNSLALLFLPLDEPFGLVVLEAGLFKKTVIVSNHGGPSEIVEHKKDGVHVDCLSPKEVCRAMEWVLQNPEKREEMGTLLRKKVLERFTLDAFRERFLRAISSLSHNNSG